MILARPRELDQEIVRKRTKIMGVEKGASCAFAPRKAARLLPERIFARRQVTKIGVIPILGIKDDVK